MRFAGSEEGQRVRLVGKVYLVVVQDADQNYFWVHWVTGPKVGGDSEQEVTEKTEALEFMAEPGRGKSAGDG